MSRAATLLAEHVTRLMDSATYREALAFRSRFHTYSLRNSWLIYVQRPDATLVAGYRTWQQLGRQVRKGETASAILAPVTRTVEENGQKERKVLGFRSASVFDLAQTDGEPVPAPPRPELLTDGGAQVARLTARLEAFATTVGFTVARRPFEGGRLGCFSPASGRIELREDLPPLQALKTLAHEVAHALMHRDGAIERHVAELEAESCAFLVCHALGLDTSRYTFPYLAAWAADPSEILPAAERADKIARSVLETLEGKGASAPSPLSWVTPCYGLKPTHASSRALTPAILERKPEPLPCSPRKDPRCHDRDPTRPPSTRRSADGK